MSTYIIRNTDTVSHNWGLIIINSGQDYELNIGDISSGSAILTFPQYGENTNLVKDNKLEVIKDGGALGEPANINFITDYFNNPYSAIGVGDMLKTTYDVNNNGIVDNSEQFGGENPDYYVTTADMGTIEGSVPPGGLISYVLTKRSNSDYDYDWSESGGSGGTSGGIPDAPDFNTYLRTSGAWVQSDQFTESDYYTVTEINTLLNDKEEYLGTQNSDGQILASSGTDVRYWVDYPTASGDVNGPTSSTNDNIAVFDGTTGKLIKDGGSTVGQINLAINNVAGDLFDHENDTSIHYPMSAIDGLVVSGGVGGEYLRKNTNADYDYDWDVVTSDDVSNNSDVTGGDVTTALNTLTSEKADTSAVDTKISKVPTAVADNIPFFDTNGEIYDSGLTSSSPNWNANQLQSTDVDLTTAPTDGQVLVWDNDNSKWVPANMAGGSVWDYDGVNKIISNGGDKSVLMNNTAFVGSVEQILSALDNTNATNFYLTSPLTIPSGTTFEIGSKNINVYGEPISYPFGSITINGSGSLRQYTDVIVSLLGTTLQNNLPNGELQFRNIRSDSTSSVLTVAGNSFKYERTVDVTIDSGGVQPVQEFWDNTNDSTGGLEDVTSAGTYLRQTGLWIASDAFDSGKYYQNIEVDSLLNGKTDTSAFDTHIADFSNPHQTSYLGLSDVSASTYSGFEGYRVTVNSTGTGLVFEKSSGSGTTAGIISRVYFTGDETTLSETFYQTSGGYKGADGTQVVNSNGSPVFFGQDWISSPYLQDDVASVGSYTGEVTISVDSDNGDSRLFVEVYLTDEQGNPVGSGSGLPNGDLGVAPITIGDTGIFDIPSNNQSSVQWTANINTEIGVTVGQRIRYHVAAQKVGGTGSGNDYTIYFGESYNTYVDVPAPVTSDSVINLSTVGGASVTNALDTLNGHVSATNNPHNVTAAQVGITDLGSTAIITTSERNNLQNIGNAVRIQTRNISSTPPTDGQIMQWDNTNLVWQMVDLPSPGGTSWGDITGTLSNQTDLQNALDGKKDDFTENTAFNKDFGTTAGTVAEGDHLHEGIYEPANPNIQGHISATNNPHSVTPTQVGNTTAQWNANQLRGISIADVTPSLGQHLVFTGGQWRPFTYTPPTQTVIHSKAITIPAPIDSDVFTMWITDTAITITKIVSQTSDGEVTATVAENNVSASTTISSATITSPNVSADTAVVYSAGSVTTTGSVNITVYYTID